MTTPWVKLVLHRPIPDGFKAKTATVTKKSDGWYVTITLVDESVPESSIEVIPTANNSIALDLGLEKFAALDTGEFVDIPQHFRHIEEKLALATTKSCYQEKR